MTQPQQNQQPQPSLQQSPSSQSQYPNRQQIDSLRSVSSCPRHLLMSSELKEMGHPQAQLTPKALYWALECDDCAQFILSHA